MCLALRYHMKLRFHETIALSKYVSPDIRCFKALVKARSDQRASAWSLRRMHSQTSA
jgi:hypothetical protein